MAQFKLTRKQVDTLIQETLAGFRGSNLSSIEEGVGDWIQKKRNQHREKIAKQESDAKARTENAPLVISIHDETGALVKYVQPVQKNDVKATIQQAQNIAKELQSKGNKGYVYVIKGYDENDSKILWQSQEYEHKPVASKSSADKFVDNLGFATIGIGLSRLANNE